MRYLLLPLHRLVSGGGGNVQVTSDWIGLAFQAVVTIGGFMAGYTALMTKLESRLVKIETQLTNISDSLTTQGGEVRRIEERLGKLESRVAKIEGSLER